MRYLTTVAALAVLSFGTAASAAGFTPPAGCETVLTVQTRDCGVSLVWRCEPDANGTMWEATFSQDGLESVVSYTPEYQWLDAVYMWDNSLEKLSPPPTDPISVTDLYANGIDTYDFIMRRTETSGSHDIRMVGADQLTGETVTIDGYDLDTVETELQIVAEDGSVEYHSRGTQYFSRKLGLYFLGKDSVYEADGAVTEYDSSPIDIILPGEPGFGATVPLYDCDKQDAGFMPAAPMMGQKEIIHDKI